MTSQQELTDARNARFMNLLQPVYGDCQRWAYTLTGNQVDAEDVLEDGILTALKSFHQLKNEDAFKTWMFRILRTSALQRHRRASPAELLEPVELDRQAPGRESGIAQRETAELVHGCLAKLAPEQRMALELFELHELSIREVAQVMGKAETAVRVQLHRARIRMAEMLREAGLDPGVVE